MASDGVWFNSTDYTWTSSIITIPTHVVIYDAETWRVLSEQQVPKRKKLFEVKCEE